MNNFKCLISFLNTSIFKHAIRQNTHLSCISTKGTMSIFPCHELVFKTAFWKTHDLKHLCSVSSGAEAGFDNTHLLLLAAR